MNHRTGLWGVLALLLGACGGEPATVPSAEASQAEPRREAPRPSDGEAALRRVMLANTAKRLCSSMFVSGRSRDHVMAQELASAGEGIDFAVNQAPRSVVASVDGQSATAVFRRHLGCTVVQELTAEALVAQFDATAYPAVATPDPDLPWPQGASLVLPEAMPGVDRAALRAAMDEAFAEPDPQRPVRTRAVVVVHDGRIIAERYAAPFDPRTPQLGWSMTKTVTSLLTGMLVGDGEFELDARAPVAAWQAGNDPRRDITLQNLLHMSSGLEFSELYQADATSDVVDMLFGAGAHDMGAYAAAKPLAHPPGTTWSYASGTSNLISRMHRQTFDDHSAYFAFPRARLFNRLNMASAVMEPDESGTFVGSSYMYATPRDWARLGLLLLEDGMWNGERLLPAGWVAASLVPAPAAPQGQYGAHIWLNRGGGEDPDDRPHRELPAEMYYLSGFEGQNVVMVPSKNLIVVRMGLTENGPSPIWRLVQEVLAALAP